MAIRRFAVKVRHSQSELALEYLIEGDIGALSIPDTGPLRWADGLWRNTCFEAFIQGQGYYEFNFAPSLAWAAYRFTDYRQGMVAQDTMEPVKMTVERNAHRFELQATVNLNLLQAVDTGNGLSLGLSAVIKDCFGGISYWAGMHPEGKPDFHHPDSFAFELGI